MLSLFILDFMLDTDSTVGVLTANILVITEADVAVLMQKLSSVVAFGPQ